MSDLKSPHLFEATDIPNSDQGSGRRWWLAVGALALAGAGFVLLSTSKYGAGLNRDSVDYFDVARSVISGKGLVFHHGEPLALWPPLYPLLLGFIGFITRLDPAAFAHLVNAMLFAFVVCLSARLFRAAPVQSTVYGLLGVCAVLFSRPLGDVYSMAFSETLFTPLVLLYLIFAHRYGTDGGGLWLAAMTVATALACLTRYIGVALLPAGVAVVVLSSGRSVRRRLAHAIAFAILSLLPLGLWLARNYALTQTFFGRRFPLGLSLADNVLLSARAVLSWYLPVDWATRHMPGHAATFVSLAVIGALAIAILLSRPGRRGLIHGLKTVLSTQLPAVLLTVSFAATMVMAAMGGDPYINSRMLSPLYVPATLLLLSLAYRLFDQTRPRGNSSKAPVALLVLWLCFPLASALHSTASRVKNGAGKYSSRLWRESETIACSRRLLSGSAPQPAVYSNDHWPLWELARVHAKPLPRKRLGYRSKHPAGQLGDLKGRWPDEGEAYIVWFGIAEGREYLFSAEQLKQVAEVVDVVDLSDGAIYRASSRGAVMGESGRRINGVPGRTPNE